MALESLTGASIKCFVSNCKSEDSNHTVPEGCTEGWAGRGDGGRVRVCNGERQEGRAGVLGGSQAAWCGSEVA